MESLIPVAAIVGIAGTSTLLNTLTGAETLAEDQLASFWIPRREI